MASLVLKVSVSLDGYVAPIDGSTDWIAAGGSDLGAGEGSFLAPLTIEPMSTTVFSGGAVAHVFAAHRRSSLIGNDRRR
jgi:hypothetical protein